MFELNAGVAHGPTAFRTGGDGHTGRAVYVPTQLTAEILFCSSESSPSFSRLVYHDYGSHPESADSFAYGIRLCQPSSQGECTPGRRRLLCRLHYRLLIYGNGNHYTGISYSALRCSNVSVPRYQDYHKTTTNHDDNHSASIHCLQPKRNRDHNIDLDHWCNNYCYEQCHRHGWYQSSSSQYHYYIHHQNLL